MNPDIASMLDVEFEKLQNLISKAPDSLKISEIVESYYQIINVSSICSMLGEQFSGNEQNPLLDKISKIQQFILTDFNSQIHPKILASLSNSIKETMKKLQSSSDKKSKEEIQIESNLFDELRKKLSTREFIEQYQKGLS